MTLVVASLVEKDIDGVTRSSKSAFESGADLVELRVDFLESPKAINLEKARLGIRGPAIGTLRSRAEGGRSDLVGDARERKLREIVDCGFEYVDLELKQDRRFMEELRGHAWKPITIASAHFQKPVTRLQLERALSEACSAGDIGKVAMHCEHAGHAILIAEVGDKFAKLGKKFVLIGMGAQGQLTRVCADRIGSQMAYACVPGKPAAPGQLDVATQKRILSEDRIVLGLLGHPVSHSVSKPMQEAALARAGLNGIYVPLDFPPKELDRRALQTLKDLGFIGLNVTIPHKAWAYEMSSIRGRSAATGAVNTLKFGRTHIVGENTDVFGFRKLLGAKIYIGKNTRCLIVGAGGVARAVVHVLREKEGQVVLTDLEMDRARSLARKYRARAVTIGALWKLKKEFDLIVNCSPVGMKGVSSDSSVKAYLFRPGVVFIDVIFNPPVTAAMRIAEKNGAETHGGLEMLVQQGAESFRIWTGKRADVDTMRDAARRALE